MLQKHDWYAQCLTPERAARNVEQQNWEGTVIPCGTPNFKQGPVPADIAAMTSAKGKGKAKGRSLLDATPTCDDCFPVFEQCGGGEYADFARCCQEGLQCTKCALAVAVISALRCVAYTLLRLTSCTSALAAGQCMRHLLVCNTLACLTAQQLC